MCHLLGPNLLLTSLSTFSDPLLLRSISNRTRILLRFVDNKKPTLFRARSWVRLQHSLSVKSFLSLQLPKPPPLLPNSSHTAEHRDPGLQLPAALLPTCAGPYNAWSSFLPNGDNRQFPSLVHVRTTTRIFKHHVLTYTCQLLFSKISNLRPWTIL